MYHSAKSQRSKLSKLITKNVFLFFKFMNNHNLHKAVCESTNWGTCNCVWIQVSIWLNSKKCTILMIVNTAYVILLYMMYIIHCTLMQFIIYMTLASLKWIQGPISQSCLKQKILHDNFSLLNKNWLEHQPQQCELNVVCAGNLFLLSNTFLG